MGFAAADVQCPTSQSSDPFLSTKIQTDKKDGSGGGDEEYLSPLLEHRNVQMADPGRIR